MDAVGVGDAVVRDGDRATTTLRRPTRGHGVAGERLGDDELDVLDDGRLGRATRVVAGVRVDGGPALEATAAVFASTVPPSSVESAVTWTVYGSLLPAASPVGSAQVTLAARAAEHPALAPAAERSGRRRACQLTLKPPALSDGPWFVTLIV